MKTPCIVGLSLVVALTGTPSTAGTFPIKLVDNLISVPTLVDGHPADGIVDSGTGGLLIDTSFAKRNGVRLGRLLGTADTSGSVKTPLLSIRLSSLQAAGLKLQNVKAIALDTGPYQKSAGAPIDVLLGSPFFRNRAITIDYVHRKLVTSDRLACPDPIRLHLIRGIPIVDASATFSASGMPRRVRLMVDLGTRHQNVIVSNTFLRSPDGARLMSSQRPHTIGVGAGGALSGWNATAPTIRVGSRLFRNIPFAATHQFSSEKHPAYDGALGVPLWLGGTIGFDYRRRTLCMGPTSYG